MSHSSAFDKTSQKPKWSTIITDEEAKSAVASKPQDLKQTFNFDRSQENLYQKFKLNELKKKSKSGLK